MTYLRRKKGKTIKYFIRLRLQTLTQSIARTYPLLQFQEWPQSDQNSTFFVTFSIKTVNCPTHPPGSLFGPWRSEKSLGRPSNKKKTYPIDSGYLCSAPVSISSSNGSKYDHIRTFPCQLHKRPPTPTMVTLSTQAVFFVP